jgi:hypothetical protein
LLPKRCKHGDPIQGSHILITHSYLPAFSPPRYADISRSKTRSWFYSHVAPQLCRDRLSTISLASPKGKTIGCCGGQYSPPCSGTFRATIGFSASNFQPPRASCFLMKLAENYFFRRYAFDTSLKASLSEEAGLGAHGNIMIFSKANGGDWIERCYIWSHVGSRPWGTDISQQCPRCKRLRPWGKPNVTKDTIQSNNGSKVVKHRIKHWCRSCPYSKMFDRSPDLILNGSMADCGRGEWYFTRRTLTQ